MAGASIRTIDHASMPRGQHLGCRVAAGYQPASPHYSACAGIEETPLLCSDIRAHGAVTPRSKAGSGPRCVPSHQLLCAEFSVRCDVIRDVASAELLFRVLYEATLTSEYRGYNQVEYLLGMPRCFD